MALRELVASVFHAARSRFGNTGILAATIYRYRRATNAADFVPEASPAHCSPPDPKSRSEIDDPAIADLVLRYSERSVSVFPLGEMVARQDVAIANAIIEIFRNTESLRYVTHSALVSHIAEFRKIFLKSPYKNNSGGANFTTALNLFLFARCLSPGLIVECGVLRGASSSILKAACPSASVHAFDPNLSALSYRTPGVTYYQKDWMGVDLRCESSGQGLCYFDDHQDQATRIIQAHKRGFKHILLDDSWPLEVPGCGWPPIPSVEMVMDNWLKVGESARWIEEGKVWTFTQTEDTHRLMDQARSLIKGAYDLPSLYRQTGVAPTSAGKFVELV